MVAAAKAVAAWVEGKEKSVGQMKFDAIGFNLIKLDNIGRGRRKIFLKTISEIRNVSKKESENKTIIFLSLLLIPGFFRSSKNTIIKITSNQIKIEAPFNEKKRKKIIKKNIMWDNFIKKIS